jgi:hypothetical protein
MPPEKMAMMVLVLILVLPKWLTMILGLDWIMCLANNDNYAITKPTSITRHNFSPTSTYIQVVATTPFTSMTYSVLFPVYY